MRAATLLLLAASICAGPSWAGPAEDLARSLSGATGEKLAGALEAARVDLALASQEEIEAFVPMIASMGRLARNAEHPATRAVMCDLHRQLVENLVADPATSASLALLEEANPLLQALDLGVGLAASDVVAAGALEALSASLPEDPTAAGPPPNDAALRIAEAFAAEKPGNQQFVARLDAWHAGLVAAWPSLSEDERRLAAGVATEPAVPPPDLVAKVTGAADLIDWLGGLDVALTDAERAAEPSLVTFLGEGHMTGGATQMILDRLAAQMTGIAASGLAGVTAGRALNGQLLHGNLSGPSVAGALLGP